MDTLLAHNASYEKLRVSIRYWMLGRNYFQACEAMEFAAAWHTGTRKDGSPEFFHQVWQAHYLRSIATSLIDPEACLTVCFLHDVVEDHPVRLADIEAAFGPAIAASVGRISKVVEGVRKDNPAYFQGMALDPVASICKGVDRIHNHASMIGVFHQAKQISYMDETEIDILPMLKSARRRFPRQEAAYENVKHMLLGQMMMVRAFQDNTPA